MSSSSSSSSSSSRVAIVTGANKGIGFAIVRALALHYPTSYLNVPPQPLIIYLTARSADRGEAALQSLSTERSYSSQISIKFLTLDISSSTSVDEFAKTMRQSHPDGIDVLINNAGIALQGFDSKVVSETLETNVHGTLQVCTSLIPMVRHRGRIVNVCSTSGKLDKYSASVREAFLKASTDGDGRGLEAINEILAQFQDAVDAGCETDRGFPSAAYAVSKAAEIALTKVLAVRVRQQGHDVLVNAVCPGYVNTDMTRGRGTKTLDEGADTPVMLALEDIQGQVGGFWRDRKLIEW